MLSLVFLLAAAPQQTEQAFLRSCEMTESGWVCRYQIPAVAAVPVTALEAPPGVSPEEGAPAADRRPAASTEAEFLAEAEARLIMRCAEASWLSLCLPGERRQARALRDAARARDERRLEVGGLLSEDRCDEAVRVALAGGDIDLAREARAFCTSRGGTD